MMAMFDVPSYAKYVSNVMAVQAFFVKVTWPLKTLLFVATGIQSDLLEKLAFSVLTM